MTPLRPRASLRSRWSGFDLRGDRCLLRLRAPTNEIVHRVAPTPENSDRVNNAHGKRPNRSSTLASDQPTRPQCGSISNLKSVASAQRSAAFSRPRWGIGLNHLPSNPITHRAQARAVSVPQDAQTRLSVLCHVRGVAGVVMNLNDAAREGPSGHAVSKTSCWLRPMR